MKGTPSASSDHAVTQVPANSDGLRWLRLAIAVAVVGAVWLMVLPWLGRLPAVARHIEDQERRGIDPSAMFYSELEIIRPIAHRIERLQETHTEDFWSREGRSRDAESPK